MAAIQAGKEFTKWLNDKLRDLKTDEAVMGPYIIGILEGDESHEEKFEVIEGILGEIIDTDINETINEIFDKWKSEGLPKADAVKKPVVDVDKQLAKLLENQKLQTTVQRVYTPEERRIREKILAEYSQTEVNDEEEDLINDEGDTGTIAKNTNAADVMQLQKERREQAKLDSQKKKDKDKEDREKQKQLREEKKEKRKTVKGERRR